MNEPRRARDSNGHASRGVGEAKIGRRRFWTRFLLFTAGVAVLVSVSPYLIGRGASEIEIPPDELMGTWSTDDPRYADRTITVTPDELTLGLGADGRTIHQIRSITVEVEPVHREYTIVYGDVEADQVLELFVYDDGLLRLRNPSDVRWTREAF